MPVARATVVLAIALATFATFAADAGAAPTTYRARLEPEARALVVEACAPGPAPVQRFEAAHRRADGILLDARRSSGAPLAREAGALVARGWRAGECLVYRADLAAAARANRTARGEGLGQDLASSPATWLWRPVAHARDPGATIAFTLPAGWSLSVPWQPLDPAPPRRRFALGTRPAAWPSLVVFGRFAETDVAAGRGALRLALPGAMAPAQRAVLERYARGTAHDVATLFPHAFAAQPQLVMLPVGAQGESVPFGQSLRGGGNAVVLYVDAGRAEADFFGNWTLTHELVHVVHPYLGDAGAWISEGIATYFQNVVRARAGRMTARQAWIELDAGFGRGRANAVPLTLRETSRVMGERRLYMRAYWSGTALALAADLAWRTRATDPTSLAAMLERFAACCASSRRRRDAESFLAELDALAGGAPVYAPLFRAHADATEFPDLAASYATLGIRKEGRALVFDPAQHALRRAIMGEASP